MRQQKVGFSRKQFASTLLVCTTARRFGVGDGGSPDFSTSDGSFVQVRLVSGGFVGTEKKISDFGPQLSALHRRIHCLVDCCVRIIVGASYSGGLGRGGRMSSSIPWSWISKT